MTDETLSKISGNIRRNMNLDLCQVHPGQVKFCLYPWLILDWQYQIFQEHVVKAQSRHEAKRDLTQWTAINHRLFSQNGLLFKGLTEDEREEVTDAMDEMETALHNDLVRLMLAVKDAVPSDDLSVSMPISAGYACACLASAAQEIYGIIYGTVQIITAKDGTRFNIPTGLENPDIKGLFVKSLSWTWHYASQHGVTNVECGKNIKDLRTTLLNKTVQWVSKEMAGGLEL